MIRFLMLVLCDVEVILSMEDQISTESISYRLLGIYGQEIPTQCWLRIDSTEQISA